MTLDKTTFKQHLTGLIAQAVNPVFVSAPDSSRFIVAYSGGLDSHVLLQLMHACELNCIAVYIDHGLQAASASWAEHCKAICQSLDIPFQSIKVDAQAGLGESPEAAARVARYQALAAIMQPDDMLLTAQHRQDQAETLLLQMLRTAGPAGLAAMPVAKRFAQGWQLRPLLAFERAELEAYAAHHQLHWIEDPSNNNERYDRNFLRHSILPLLKQRWPSINQTLVKVSKLQAEAAELVNELAELDGTALIDGQTLLIERLIQLTPVRQKNVVRYWLQQLELDIPPAKRLEEILGSMLTAAEDRCPAVCWKDTEVRRFQGRLYGMKRMSEFDATTVVSWNGQAPVILPTLDKEVRLTPAEHGLRANIVGRSMTLRFRQGGENIKPSGRHHTVDLKKLMQQAHIPPWERSRIPLLYLNERLVAVADYWVADDFKNEPDQPGWRFVSRRV